MFIVRKNYLIKTITFILSLGLIISGIFLSEKSQEKNQEEEIEQTIFMLINNIYASTQIINSSFDKAIKTGSFENEKNEIHTQSYSIKNLVYFAAPNMENTIKWFSNLCEYSKTDMSDPSKNTYYSEKISEAGKLLLDVCSSYQKQANIDKIERLFVAEENTEYYANKLRSLEDEYPMLNHQITANRSDINELAKTILNFPISPKQFYGNYKAPKSISYSHLASYAEIFPSGKFLNRMAVENTVQKNAVSELTPNDAAEHYTILYASYAENCKRIFSKTSNKLIYFAFYPETTSDDKLIINYNEAIKLAINTKDNSLKAFDASAYLKNHKKENNIITPCAQEPPMEIEKSEVISKKTAILGNKTYTEYYFSPDGTSKYYLLYHTDNSKEIYTEDEYFRKLNLY